jgi:hypothetical protein
MGFMSKPEFYTIYMLLFIQNITDFKSNCMFYQIPHDIKVYTTYKDIFVGIQIHTIPLYILLLIITVIFAIRCPFSERSHESTNKLVQNGIYNEGSQKK